MNYLNYLKDKWNELLAEKVDEKVQTSGGSGGDSGTGGSASKSPLEELESYIKSQYASSEVVKPELGEVPVYDRMETNLATDAEIEKTAKSLLQDYANQTKNSIEDEIAALEKKYSTQKDNAKTGYEQEDAKLGEIYKEAKESASNGLLKRGLARSSISANIVSGLDGELADKRAAALQGYVSDITALAGEIAALESKRQKALNDFDISYAAKLTEQINKLTEKRDEQYKEALKYNNTITEKEYEQAVQKQLDESKLYTDELNQAKTEKESNVITASQQKQIYENTYGKMDEILGLMSKSEAKELLESSKIFREYLSDYYYYKLLDKYGR